jgi:hypothetical protein
LAFEALACLMALRCSFVASSVAQQQQQQQQRLLLAAPTHPVQSLAWKYRCPPAKRLLTASKALAPTFLMNAMLSGEQQTKRMEHSEAGALDGYLERVQACNNGQVSLSLSLCVCLCVHLSLCVQSPFLVEKGK